MKLKIGQKIGKGGQSEVFEALDDNNNKFAVKVFFDEGPFQNELEVMKAIGEINSPNLSKLIATSEFDNGSHGIVMPLLGKNFRICIKASEDKNVTSIKYATQMIDAIECLHKCGYIHCDIKSENFIVSQDMDTITLIDYGLCHRFQDRDAIYQFFIQDEDITSKVDLNSNNANNGEKKSTQKYFKGTLTYASLNCMKGKVHSYRDDLESLAYVLLYAKVGSLPWQKHRKIIDIAPDIYYLEDKREKIYEEKFNFLKTYKPEDYKEDITNVVKFLKYAVSLKETEIPDYDYCKDLFAREMKRMNSPLKYKKDLFEFMRCSDISYSKKPSISCFKDNQSFNATPFGSFKNKVICIKDSDDNIVGKDEQDSENQDVIFYNKPTFQKKQNHGSDKVILPKMSNNSSRDLHDNTLPTKTQSAHKKNHGRSNKCPSPANDEKMILGSAEDLLNNELMKKIIIAPKVNPRLRIIKEEEQRFSNSFVFTPKDETIKKLDDECNDLSASLSVQFHPVKRKEENKSTSSHCEDLKSNELTEFYQYSSPQEHDYDKEIMNEDFVYRPKDLKLYNTSDISGSGKASFSS
ncbi:unnamed protein product [Moneuplotes crassus]|uniref:Casein kinase I n=1 Tax=Euplotes crassus TaxID=5936 RepID=A0AAD1U549_EUPCR|nr:unnamed protein product [Moneuplotes crassus]